MIDPKDDKTGNLIPEAKKRGRPSTGKAMTAAERKRKSRQEGERKPFNEMSDTQLIEMIGYGKGFEFTSRNAWRELGKRRGWTID